MRRATALCLFFLTGNALADATWERRRFVAFGDELSGWLLLEVHGHEIKRLTFPPTLVADSVATSRDGALIVFTAVDQSTGKRGVYKWQYNSSPQPKPLAEGIGYYADVALSLDQQWVYFIHHPLGGPPGQHQQRAYAQLYRAHLNAEHIEMLTTEDGCHLSPTAQLGSSVVVVHSNCQRGRELVRLNLGNGTSQRLTAEKMLLDEPALAPDGKSLLFSVSDLRTLTIFHMQLATRRLRNVLTFPRDAPRARPQFGARPGELLYQSSGAIWVVSRGEQRRLASIAEKNR